MSINEVKEILRHSVGESWNYSDNKSLMVIRYDKNGYVDYKSGFKKPKAELNRNDLIKIEKYKKIKLNMTKEEVLNILGSPNYETRVYSKSPNDSSYKVRSIRIQNNKVIKKNKYYYYD